MGDNDLRIDKADLVEMLRLESRVSAVETLISVQREELKALGSSLTRIEDKLNQGNTDIKVQQVELSNIVKSLRETTKRNAWTVGALIAAASVVTQLLVVGLHL